jgi:hypothetical protein
MALIPREANLIEISKEFSAAMSDILTFHPLADIFPLLEGDAFAALVADIVAHGLREPIIVDADGVILDGRNRFRACLEGAVPVCTRVFDGDDPLAFVISANVHRRHLDESRRAMVATKLASMPPHRPGSAHICAVSQDRAAEMLVVSRRLVQHARKVQAKGAPELIAAVEQGVMKVTAAAGIVHYSPERQVARIERDRLKAVGESRQSQEFYRTPAAAVAMLLAKESFSPKIWECACGDGSISRELEAHGYMVVSTDLHDRGYGQPGTDFLTTETLLADDVVTNPPYDEDMPEKFAIHALELGARKVALLCRLTWLEGMNRYRALFSRRQLARVWVFSPRQTLWRGDDAAAEDDGGQTAYAWFIFERGHNGAAIDWLPGDSF